jgi:ABC-2 type transport system permease protein
MEISIPKTSDVLKALLKADFTTLWRNRRANLMTLIMPLIIVFTWKGLMPGQFILSNAITLGVIAVGLMGYSNSIARDRDKGVFQRLRVSPLPLWTIMASRLIVQLFLILLLTVIVFVSGYQSDQITIGLDGYIIGLLCSLLGGAVYLSLGQAIVGRIQNPETVNSTSRLIYLAFILTGMLGQFPYFGKEFRDAIDWTPYGTVKTILAAGLEPSTWNNHTTMALLVTIGYTVVFATLGIKWFKWSNK